MSPKQIVPLLADRGTYVASESTFYRVLHDEQLQHARTRTRTRPPAKRPREHVADGFVTPADRHAGLDVEILAARRCVYERARRRRPER